MNRSERNKIEENLITILAIRENARHKIYMQIQIRNAMSIDYRLADFIHFQY